MPLRRAAVCCRCDSAIARISEWPEVDKGQFDSEVARQHVADVDGPGVVSSVRKRRARREAVACSSERGTQAIVERGTAIGAQNAERIGAHIKSRFIRYRRLSENTNGYSGKS